MKTDNIQKFIQEFVEIVKTNFTFQGVDREEIKNEIKNLMSEILKEIDLTTFIKDQIHQYAKKTDIVHCNIIEKDVVDARIITETRESAEVNEKMKQLSAEVMSLKKIVQEFNYAELINKAIDSVKKDIDVTNAIIHNKDVVNCNIKEEDRVIPRIVEKLEITKVPYILEEPEFRKRIYYLDELFEKRGGKRVEEIADEQSGNITHSQSHKT